MRYLKKLGENSTILKYSVVQTSNITNFNFPSDQGLIGLSLIKLLLRSRDTKQ
jgi:hypothetical protein